MLKNIGVSFVGGGNMASAIIDAILSSKKIAPGRISVFDPFEEKQISFKEKGVCVSESNIRLASDDASVLFLAVKPQMIDSVLEELKGKVKSKCVVSIAAGVSTSHIKNILGEDIPVIRALPNTPMLVLEGMTVVASAPEVDKELFDFVLSIFKTAGEVMVIPEEKMNEVIPLSSSSPAFFFRILHAMALSGAKNGISYSDSLKLSSEAMKGSAQYLLSTDKTAEELIRQVSSPGGTTIAALSAFDDFGFEGFIDEVTKRCIDRAYELGKKQKK